MREGANRDEVNAQTGDGRDAFQRDAAAGFEQASSVCQTDSFAHFVVTHVVQQDVVGSGLGRRNDVIQRVSFDLDLEIRRPFPACLDGTCNSSDTLESSDREVIVFDHYPIVKAESMVGAASHGDGVLLQCAKTWSGLARIQDFGVTGPDSVDVTARLCRDPAEALKEVERGSFPGKQRPGTSCYNREFLARNAPVSVLDQGLEGHCGVKFGEDGFRDGQPGAAALFARDQRSLGHGRGRDDSLGGGIPTPDVLGEGLAA